MQSEINPANSHPREWDADDVAIASAMHRVSVPAASLARARARLRAFAMEETGEESGCVPLPLAGEDSSAVAAAPTAAAALSVRRMPRRLFFLGSAAAAVVAFAVLYLQTQPISQLQLTTHCIEQLELLSEHAPQWLPPPADAASRLKPLTQSMNQQLNLVGYKRHAAAGLADACTIWKFVTSNGKSLYVFDFDSPRPVRDISGRLQFIRQSSSSWSLAAVQQGEQLLVAAVEGDIERYFKPLQLA